MLIGVFGTLAGTAVGLGIGYYFQANGLDFSSMMKNVSAMLPAVYRTHVTPPAFGIGFIPGLLSTLLGTALAGIGIYRRSTAQLFKELEI